MTLMACLAAAIFAGLAGLHLTYTLHDLFLRPRYFVPRDRTLLPAMQATQIALAPNGRDYWSASLGFHMTHSIGLLLYALLIVLATATPLSGLRPLLIALGLALTLISWRCFFRVPTAGCAVASGLMIAAWVF